MINVLDNGFVRLVDMMGDDSAIVQAARTSYGKGTKTFSEDRKLIRYLMRNRHTSPFEMVEFKFHIKLPIFVARQWIRHRTANVNEYSGRYSEMKNEFYLPEVESVRKQSLTNKQGRDDEELSPNEANEFIAELEKSNSLQFESYQNFIDKGIARELARINLPLSIYTEWYWKIDLHNLFHFLKLRLDSHAQLEIRLYAEVIAEILKEKVPLAYEAFEDYILEAVNFSKKEQIALSKFCSNFDLNDETLLDLGLDKREITEFRNKISKLQNKQSM
ncbi:MAG: FAD-dependent thymidylate synthase [Ignavibacteria bacterium]|jgi:thymidylate synthase (FAD)|nr:FAD-dependent thymidylate synthase [Ignavibacteria bacterium]